MIDYNPDDQWFSRTYVRQVAQVCADLNAQYNAPVPERWHTQHHAPVFAGVALCAYRITLITRSFTMAHDVDTPHIRAAREAHTHTYPDYDPDNECAV